MKSVSSRSRRSRAERKRGNPQTIIQAVSRSNSRSKAKRKTRICLQNFYRP
jgi:hypothetical protein